MRAGEHLSDSLLATSVVGLNLSPGTLGDQLAEDVNLLVFLRHLGCMFCRETIGDLRELCESDPEFPRPLFFFEGRSSEGRALLGRQWPEARAIADPGAWFYEAFGIRRGGLVKMFGPGVWEGRARAAAKGHQNGQRQGDIFRMPGTFLSVGSEIIWAHEHRHAADHPDYAHVRELAVAAAIKPLEPRT